ncbi:tetratricopeptide repeat protein [Duganella sp. FT92W]|uniref:Tetratricopeptide repeat protein n=1 Tax=Pseudoduganella rivuli TaxID=2666085 RepID=A0A7X2IRT5_9BURK|nr:tetratricopeptide repeat protein [Pseudoduganella rivuli]MRV74859.1 tetratricopeptide repeat protein [Pseudoduganella rivuli]
MMDHPQLAGTDSGAVTTFYSYRGGAGCTMALAHVGALLADRGPAGTPVLMVDWDLDAPGLHEAFPAGPDAPGVVELFAAYRDQLLRRGRADGGDDDGGEALAQAVLAAIDWQHHVVRVDQRRPLFLMRAGRLDDGHAQRLAGLDWEALFHACPALFRCFGAMLARHFGHVLVDAPHGRSAGAGVCTALLPQRLVLLFDANRPGLDGLESLVQRVTTFRVSQDGEPRALMIYPVPARMAADDTGQRARVRRGDPAAGLPGYQPLFERVLADAYGAPSLSLDSYFNEVLVPHVREPAGAAGDRGDHDDRCAPVRAYEALLAWMEPGHPPWCALRELPLLEQVTQARAALDGSAARQVQLARDLFRLGEAYRDGGRDARAALAFRESAALYAAGAGEAHPDTAAARAQLAALLLHRRQFDEARLLLRQASDTLGAALGPQHQEVLALGAMQAQALAGQGYVTAALARLQDVLDVQLRTLGAGHPATLDSQALRAALLSQAGDMEAARLLLEQVLAARTRLSGAQHAATLRAADALAHVVSRIGADTMPEAVRQPVPGYGTAEVQGPAHPDNVYALRDAKVVHGEPESGAGCAELS